MKRCVICKVEKKNSEFTICRQDYLRCNECHEAIMKKENAKKLKSKSNEHEARKCGEIKAAEKRQVIKNIARSKIEDMLIQRKFDKVLKWDEEMEL